MFFFLLVDGYNFSRLVFFFIVVVVLFLFFFRIQWRTFSVTFVQSWMHQAIERPCMTTRHNQELKNDKGNKLCHDPRAHYWLRLFVESILYFLPGTRRVWSSQKYPRQEQRVGRR
jgi:hypothetical protein